MKFTVEKSSVVNALQHLQGVVATRTTLPILSNIHLEAVKTETAQGIILTATDLDLFLRVRVPATVEESGSATMPARKLFSILKEATAENIKVVVNDKNQAAVSFGGSAYKIMGLAPEDFPIWPQQGEVKAEVTLPQAELAKILRHTIFAASTDETRYVLNGVLLKIEKGTLTAVGTDGRRLATIQAAGDLKVADCETILPSAAVQRLIGVLGDESDLKLVIGPQTLEAHLGDVKLSTKLIEGTFPNYRQVIPTECKERIPMSRESLIAALRRASLMASAKSETVKMAFSKDLLVISANTPELGEARESLAIKYAGKEFAIAFNPKYLLDALTVIKEEEVVAEFIDELSPGVIRTATPDDFKYIIMPIRLN